MFELLQQAARDAQSTLAQLHGAADDGAANFTIAGTSYQGVLHELSTQVPGTGTGFETIRELSIVAERTQFTSKPDATARPAVTALGATWYLTNVGESPVHYLLTCRPA